MKRFKKIKKAFNKNKKKMSEVFDNESDKHESERIISDMIATKKIVENLKSTVEIYEAQMVNINKRFSCLQFQLIVQDLNSILHHIESLETKGPSPAHEEIPLEKSEMEPTEHELKLMQMGEE